MWSERDRAPAGARITPFPSCAGVRGSARLPSSPARSPPSSRLLTLKATPTEISHSAHYFSFVLGIGLYGLTLVYPLYLGRVRGYDALMIGETMFVSGLAMFFTAPVAGRLVAK